MTYSDDAKKRLAALHQPIPRPTKAAVAQNRAEEDSRREANTLDRLMSVVKKGPDTAQAAKVGEPTLVDPTPVSANQLAGETMRRALGPSGGANGISLETVKSGAPGPNDPAPRSDAPSPAVSADPFARPTATPTADPNELKPTATDANELKPNAAPDPNELKPSTDAQSAAVPPPVQVNEIQQGQPPADANAAAASSSSLATDQDISSSKKKKKTGLKKIIGF
jgi:outer membrane protein assembly factor BamD